VQNSRFSEAGQKLHGVLNGCAVNVGQRSNANDEVNYDWTTKIFSPEPTSSEGAGPHIRISTPGSTTKKAAPRISIPWALVTDKARSSVIDVADADQPAPLLRRWIPSLHHYELLSAKSAGGWPIFAGTSKWRLPQLSFLWKAGYHGPQRLHFKPSSEPSSPLSAPRSPARSHALRQHNTDSCSMPIVAAPAPALASQDCDACIATSLRAFSR
jgi:hypothetical protein